MESIIETRSYEFALKCLKTAKRIQIEKKEFHISQQLIKSATSIGANVREANSAESLKDFVHKMRIALKEASETNYWCTLIRDSGMISNEEGDSLAIESIQIRRILGKIVSTSTKRLKS